tara:strand:- start:1315 stop:2130 length:816 start_codon:yes stop_codon:yes gene_type:complete
LEKINRSINSEVNFNQSESLDINFEVDRFHVRVVNGNDLLIKNAQKLRFNTFFKESSVNNSDCYLDSDKYDKFCDHLVVIDKSVSSYYVVGTYRLMVNSTNNSQENFYTETEFDLYNLKKLDLKILEVGRSCVHKNYRDGKIIRLLWKGLSTYIKKAKVDLIIGCASFQCSNTDKIENQLSFLKNFYSAPKKYLTFALKSKRAKWKNIDITKIPKSKIFKSLPPLIKAYLRVGAWVGDGAVFDPYFKTIDICIILKSDKIEARYLKMAVNH